MYEEKSTEEIASQVGLSENATRQLIFRARAAFKKALIGDVDTTGMSAAAILSVAARKAASEGKKVGAAALTLIALVVMSLTVFPGLNRATTDQMAEAPASSGSSSESGQSAVSNESNSSQSGAATESATTDPTETAVTPETEDSTEASQAAAKVAPSPTPSAQAAKKAIEAVLESPSAGAVYNSDAKSMVLVIDQNYAVIGDNGLTATFSFNPTTSSVFSEVNVDVKIDTYAFEFKPTNTQLISGKNGDKQDVYILVGDATYLYDESGKKWSKTDLGKSRIKIEVVMEPNGTAVKSINLVMLTR
jgi:RNA polymerase sigma-70 factor (ECF subfamily)